MSMFYLDFMSYLKPNIEKYINNCSKCKEHRSIQEASQLNWVHTD